METRLLYLHALSPIHCGAGQSVDVIDVPVAREKVTNLPYLPGSSIKGVLRDACRPADNDDATTTYRDVFGPELAPGRGDETGSAGRLWFADGRLLCLPVRSLFGSFLWTTSPLLLRRWLRDGGAGADLHALVPTPSADQILISSDARPVISRDGTVFLEDLDLTAHEHDGVAQLGTLIAAAVFDPTWRDIFRDRFGIVSDDLFTFLAETGTEVTARVRLDDDSKTVADGGLWYEEAVPAEAIFVSPLVAAPRAPATELFAFVVAHLAQPLQIGGNASVGCGLVRCQLAAGLAS